MTMFRWIKRIAISVLCFGLSAVCQDAVSAPQPPGKVYCADPGLCLHASDAAEKTPTGTLMFGPGQHSADDATRLIADAAQASTNLSPQAAPAKLTLRDAEQMALKNHPRITIAELNALASQQAVREVRSAFFPTVGMNATGVTTLNDGNRITAGLLNNPSVFNRTASGLTGSQLITDFGRTRNLAASANLNFQSQQQDTLATREQIVFTVDQTFFNALSADVLVKVADQTVQARQVLVNQIQALENAKLRSALDLSFANVSLAQAQLLLVNAKNNRDAAYATLSEALGLPNQQAFELADTEPAQPPTQDIDTIIQQALDNRPDLKALELAHSADEHLATAEERLQLPDVNALGATGLTPVASNRLGTNGYGAVGVNIHIPVFNGFLFSARAREARLRSQAAAQRVRELKDAVSREVRVAWLNMNSAFDREDVATKLLDQATLALNLAQARYNLGLSSIVELSQAQLQQVEAEISTVTAKYDYQLSISALAFRTGSINH